MYVTILCHYFVQFCTRYLSSCPALTSTWPSIFKIYATMTATLPSSYYAAVCDTGMEGDEHHHPWPYYAIMTDDLPPPSWLAHKIHRDSASADDIKIFFSAYVRRITNKRLLLAMPSQHPNVYCIVASGALHWQMWPFLFISSGRIICIKNIEFYHPPTWI